MIWALHGAVGQAQDWREVAAMMRERGVAGGEVVRCLDLWRFLDCCSMPLDELGAALASEIARVDSSPVLMGYSMGGRLALHALLAAPEMWNAAILVSAHPGLEDEVQRRARRLADAEWAARALKSEWSEFLELWQAQSVLQGGRMPGRMALKKRRASVARSFIDWSLGAQENLTPRLSEIACPVMWVTGAGDEKFGDLGRAAAECWPSARHEVVADSGHRVPWQQTERFVDLCVAFLEQDVLPLEQ